MPDVGSRANDSTSHDSDSKDLPDSLDRALDSFLDWAGEADLEGGAEALPSPELIQSIGPGSVLGDFQLGRRLGSGGMGVVYEAGQRSVGGRRVAVKVLRNLFSSRRVEERFRREIAAISSLDHPSIVPVVAAGVEKGVPYYAMKMLTGMSAAHLVRSLKEHAKLPPEVAYARALLERSAKGDSSTSGDGRDARSAWEPSYPRWVARLGMQVAEALQHAHARGVIHRDVKPGNMAITPAGRAVLLDFGLAGRSDDATLTQTGDFLGTEAYASPEQVRGEELDGRSDVYSLGASLYEMLVLRRPFELRETPVRAGNVGSSAVRSRTDLVRRIATEDASPLDDSVPRDLRTIVGCAIANVPEKRYASAAAMASDLRAFLAGQPIRARPPGVVARAWSTVRRHPVVAAAVVLLVAGTFLALDFAQRRAAADDALARGDAAFERATAARGGLRSLTAAPATYADWRRAGTYPPPEPTERARLEAARRELERSLVEARAHYNQAFELVADHAPARAAVAGLLAAELRYALEDDLDLFDPERVRLIEADLARFDDAGQHAEILDRRGSFHLVTTPPGARVEVEVDAAGAPLRGTTPFEADGLVEGSYVATVELAGYAPARYPFLVRRASRETAGRLGPGNRHEIALLPEGSLPEGFVFVPEGWTLCQDDPPRWEYVQGFAIDRFETTFGDWLALRNECDHGLRPPRDAYESSILLVESGEAWRPRADVPADWPLYGLARTDFERYLSELQRHFPPPHGDFYYSFPTRAEWIRAARGADARTHPWPGEFDWSRCAGHPAHEPSGEVGAFPIGFAEGDVSPFGVRDMAGSVIEATLSPFPSVRGEFLFCGGSFRDTLPSYMGTLMTRAALNQPRPDAGMRAVVRRYPDWYLRGTAGPRIFRDDFERSDSSDPGEGWVLSANYPLRARVDPDMIDFGRLQDGKLVLEGGFDNHSEPACAYRVIDVTERGFTLSALVSATSRVRPEGRGFGVQAASDLGEDAHGVKLAVTRESGRTREGATLIASTPATQKVVVPTEPGLSRGPLRFELRVRPDRIEGRIWPADSPRPAEPRLVLEDHGVARPLRLLWLSAPNYVGARVEYDDVEVVPAELE